MLNVSHYMVHSKHLTTFQVSVSSYMRTKKSSWSHLGKRRRKKHVCLVLASNLGSGFSNSSFSGKEGEKKKEEFLQKHTSPSEQKRVPTCAYAFLSVSRYKNDKR